MRPTFFLFILCCGSLWQLKALAQADNPLYDPALAQKLGGDDYGMKSYYLVILKTGSNTVSDKSVTDSLFRGHMNNINKLAAEKKLVVAGPLGKNPKNYRGIFILDAKSHDDANALVKNDPAVLAKVFDVEIYQWYGSAALPEYLKSHEKIEKKKH